MWFVSALIVGAGVIWLALWLRGRGTKVTWYEWLIGIAGLLLLLFTLQNYFGSIAEFWPNAASKFLLVTGLPAVILMAIAISLAWRSNRAKV